MCLLLENLVLDGTPRDCIPSGCGSQVDTAIIRDPEILNGRSALGWTLGGGDVDPAKIISTFMSANRRSSDVQESAEHRSFGRRGDFWNLPVVGALGFGGRRHAWPKETIVGDTAGQGATSGLPTTDDDGIISMIYRQVSLQVSRLALILLHIPFPNYPLLYFSE